MKYQTKISTIINNEEILSGYKLSDLAHQKNFPEAIFLALRGELPTAEQAKMFNALLIMAIDHSGTASAQTAQIAASAKSGLAPALAAGILAMGDRHGGAVQKAAEFFVEHRAVPDVMALMTELKSKKIRVPGFGHAVLTHDNRTDVLFGVAKETGCFGDYSKFALTVGEALNAISSKPLPLNVDGAMAAILLDMGFPAALATGVFIIARVPGLVAHIAEEMASDAGLRRVPEEDLEYIGPAERSIV